MTRGINFKGILHGYSILDQMLLLGYWITRRLSHVHFQLLEFNEIPKILLPSQIAIADLRAKIEIF